MNDPKETVKQYLSQNGYPFEMFVAKQFRSAGFEVYQSTLYVDKESGKDRDIDVTAYYVRVIGDIQFSFKVLIECKYATNIWVLFTGENHGFRDFKVDSLYGSNYAGRELLTILSQIDDFNAVLPFRLNQILGYGLTEAVKNTKQEESRTTYKAIMTLLNALQYEKEKEQGGKIFEIYIPMIAIQGRLFECYLNDNDKEEINEIKEGQLLYKSNVFPGVFPIIEIVTKEKVFEIATKLYSDLNAICTTYFSQVQHLIKNFPSDPNFWGIE